MKQRDIAQELASQTNEQDDWRKFKNLRNTVVGRLKGEKNQWEKDQLDHLGHNSTDLWQNVKGWLGWKLLDPPPNFLQKNSSTNQKKLPTP